eukprot:Platyproteum_vivax@DN1066_c0_g1_i1.p1
MGCSNSKKKGVDETAQKPPEPTPAPEPEPVVEEEPVVVEEEIPEVIEEVVIEEEIAMVEEEVAPPPPPVVEFPLKQSSWFHQGTEYDYMLDDMANNDITELVDGIWDESRIEEEEDQVIVVEGEDGYMTAVELDADGQVVDSHLLNDNEAQEYEDAGVTMVTEAELEMGAADMMNEDTRIAVA